MTPPVIETDRLILRGPALQDYDALGDYFADDPRSKWNGGPRARHQMSSFIFSVAGQWALRGHGLWHITLKGDDGFIGFAGVLNHIDWPEPELAYGLTANAEGKGIAFEAATAARQAAATHCGLTRLISFLAPRNARSQALLARLGATFEATTTLRGTDAQIWRHPEVTP